MGEYFQPIPTTNSLYDSGQVIHMFPILSPVPIQTRRNQGREGTYSLSTYVAASSLNQSFERLNVIFNFTLEENET